MEFKLDDGTNSVKDYVSDWRLNRFNTKEMARKNRILAPTKVIHFYGVSRDMSEDDIEKLFEEYCAPPPHKVKFVESKKERDGGKNDEREERSGVGLAYFNSVEVGDCFIRLLYSQLGNMCHTVFLTADEPF